MVIGTGLVLPPSPSPNPGEADTLETEVFIFLLGLGRSEWAGHLLIGVEVQVEGWWMVDNLGRDDRLQAGTWLGLIVGQTLLACTSTTSSVARDVINQRNLF